MKGIGETLAKRIVKARPFGRLEDLLSIKGVTQNHLDGMREQGVIVRRLPPKPLNVKLVGKVEADQDEKVFAYVFDEQERFLALQELKEGERLQVTERNLGKTVTLFAGPKLETIEVSLAERFRRGGYVERRFTIPSDKLQLNIGKWIFFCSSEKPV